MKLFTPMVRNHFVPMTLVSLLLLAPMWGLAADTEERQPVDPQAIGSRRADPIRLHGASLGAMADPNSPLDLDCAPLESIPAWITSEDGTYGQSVSGAGDVNGDGFGDIIIGSIDYWNHGGVSAYLGSATGLSAVPDWRVVSDQTGDGFGWSVATAGDVNNDGFSDIIVGDYRRIGASQGPGHAYLYLGSADGLSTDPAWVMSGSQDLAVFGFDVSSAGDVNGDGYDDVIIGAPEYDDDHTDEGRAFLFLGSSSGLSPAPDWTADGEQPGALFGWSVAGAGDVNGDGFDDLLVGALNFHDTAPGEGLVALYMGSPSGPSSLPSWRFDGGGITAAYLGYVVAAAGDVNGDGFGDVVLGATGATADTITGGRAFLFLGSVSGLPAEPAWTIEGAQDGQWMGGSLASAGDVNADGYGDIIVGSPGLSGDLRSQGRVLVFTGSPTGLQTEPDWEILGDEELDLLSWSVAGAGDVDGDGAGDIVLGNSRRPDRLVYAYRGIAGIDVAGELDALTEYVETLQTSGLPGRGLVRMLVMARRTLERGRTSAAVNVLGAFRKQVAGLAGRSIGQTDAELLDAAAARLMEYLNDTCS